MDNQSWHGHSKFKPQLQHTFINRSVCIECDYTGGNDDNLLADFIAFNFWNFQIIKVVHVHLNVTFWFVEHITTMRPNLIWCAYGKYEKYLKFVILYTTQGEICTC